MEAKELRIGNYVKVKKIYFEDLIDSLDWDEDDIIPEDRVLQVCEISRTEFRLFLFDEYEFNYNEVEPIPLTEQWLIDFGFKKSEFTYDLDKLSICLKGIAGYKNGRTYWNSWCIKESQPLHIHQLQNLYFSLTGQELTK